MAESRLTAVISTKGAAKSKTDLDKFTKAANDSDKSVSSLAKTTSKSRKSINKDISSSSSTITKFGRDANKALVAIEGPLGGVASRAGALSGLLTPVGIAVGATTAAVIGLTAAFSSGVSTLDEYNIGLAKTEALLNATGFAAGVTAEELQKEAEAIALNTLASVQGIQQAQSVLITFNKVSGAARKQAVNLSQDLATVFGGTAASQATQLGKALQDPVKGITALNRVGVSFTETQKEQIKLFSETGKSAQAQAIILNALQEQVGGAGAAVAKDSLAGKTDTLGQNWDKLLSSLADKTGVYEKTISFVDRLGRGVGNTAALLDTDILSPDEEGLSGLERIFEINTKLAKLEQQRRDAAGQYLKLGVIDREIEKQQQLKDEILSSVNLEAKAQSDKLDAFKKSQALQKKIRDDEANAIKLAQEQENIDRLAKWRESIEQGNAVWSNEYTGYGSKAYTDSVREQQFELANVISESNNALAEEQIELAKRIGESFSSDLAGGIVDSIVAAENLGDALLGVVGSTAEAVAKALLEQVIQTQIVDRVIGGLYAKNKAAEVAATVQQAGLNAFASTAGAPFPINLSAPAAAAAATASAGSLGAGVVAAASAREQGGQLSAGQLSTGAERDQFEVIAPASASRVRTANQMRSIMGEGGGTNVNLTVIDQSEGAKEYTESTNDQGDTVLLIRNVVSGDLQSQNSDIAKARRNTRNQAGF